MIDEKIRYYLYDILNDNTAPPGAPEEVIKSVQQSLDFELPEEYLDFVRICNGGEGEIGECSYLKLYPVEDLIEVNKDYILLMEQIPDYFLIGKDAADTGFAFHKHNHTFTAFGLMSYFKTDGMDFHVNGFVELIEYLYNDK